MAAATSRIGIVPTFAHPPYLLARMMASLDQIASGRIGWNMVTGTSDVAARNYGLDKLPEHGLRYAMAETMEEVGDDGFLFSMNDVSRRSVVEVAHGRVPALQRRGLARRAYAHAQFRDNLREF
jgi:hypothetical protein